MLDRNRIRDGPDPDTSKIFFIFNTLCSGWTRTDMAGKISARAKRLRDRQDPDPQL
jgi:hypothetical protein